jgi:hypothetical protein
MEKETDAAQNLTLRVNGESITGIATIGEIGIATLTD